MAMNRLRRHCRNSLLRVVALLFLPQTVLGAANEYDRVICLKKTIDIQTNDPNFFSQNPNSVFPGSTLANPLLTLEGCRNLCGSQWGVYPNAGQRVFEWIFPALLLIANMHFAPIGKRRYSIVIHLLGDPCDTLFRIVSTVEDRRECFRKSQDFIQAQERRRGETVRKIGMQPEIITEVISLDTTRLIESLDAHKFSTHLYGKLDLDKVSLEELKNNYSAFCKTARALRRQRQHNLRRTGVAITVYIVQVISVFIPQLGAVSPSGGMVSPSMLLVWLLPIVMLSNVGDYASWGTARETLIEFLDVIGVELEDLVYGDTKSDPESMKLTPIHRTTSELACSGTVIRSHSNSHYRGRYPTAVLIIISVIPVTLGCAAAFVSDYTAPTYFSCRATSIILFYIAWLMSFSLTRLMLRFQSAIGRCVWEIILLKDFVIATTILTLILVSTCGWYNSCFCASGYILRRSKAYVDLNPVRFYPLNNKVIYPGVVFTTLALELLLPLFVYAIQYQGFQAIWWSEPKEHVPAAMESTQNTTDEPEVTTKSEDEDNTEERRRTE